MPGKKPSKAACHKDRPHYAHGYCRNCYAAYLRNKGKIPVCEHKDRPVKGLGLCTECYDNRKSGSVNSKPIRQTRLMKKYGITIEQKAELTKNGCAICGGPRTNHDYHLDHDHITGKFRGFLCHKCNTGLGSFSDSPDILRKAIMYLEAIDGT